MTLKIRLFPKLILLLTLVSRTWAAGMSEADCARASLRLLGLRTTLGRPFSIGQESALKKLISGTYSDDESKALLEQVYFSDRDIKIIQHHFPPTQVKIKFEPGAIHSGLRRPTREQFDALPDGTVLYETNPKYKDGFREFVKGQDPMDLEARDQGKFLIYGLKYPKPLEGRPYGFHFNSSAKAADRLLITPAQLDHLADGTVLYDSKNVAHTVGVDPIDLTKKRGKYYIDYGFKNVPESTEDGFTLGNRIKGDKPAGRKSNPEDDPNFSFHPDDPSREADDPYQYAKFEVKPKPVLDHRLDHSLPSRVTEAEKKLLPPESRLPKKIHGPEDLEFEQNGIHSGLRRPTLAQYQSLPEGTELIEVSPKYPGGIKKFVKGKDPLDLEARDHGKYLIYGFPYPKEIHGIPEGLTFKDSAKSGKRFLLTPLQFDVLPPGTVVYSGRNLPVTVGVDPINLAKRNGQYLDYGLIDGPRPQSKVRLDRQTLPSQLTEKDRSLLKGQVVSKQIHGASDLTFEQAAIHDGLRRPTLEQFNSLPDGVELIEVSTKYPGGFKKFVKGKDKMDLEARDKGKYLIYGFTYPPEIHGVPSGMSFQPFAKSGNRNLLTPLQFDALPQGSVIYDAHEVPHTVGVDPIDLTMKNGKFIDYGFLNTTLDNTTIIQNRVRKAVREKKLTADDSPISPLTDKDKTLEPSRLPEPEKPREIAKETRTELEKLPSRFPVLLRKNPVQVNVEEVLSKPQGEIIFEEAAGLKMFPNSPYLTKFTMDGPYMTSIVSRTWYHGLVKPAPGQGYEIFGKYKGLALQDGKISVAVQISPDQTVFVPIRSIAPGSIENHSISPELSRKYRSGEIKEVFLDTK
jgi:hypothetical protein